jgi:CRP/FNR family transcriptional regulator, cyclic AMP receptor protein
LPVLVGFGGGGRDDRFFGVLPELICYRHGHLVPRSQYQRASPNSSRPVKIAHLSQIGISRRERDRDQGQVTVLSAQSEVSSFAHTLPVNSRRIRDAGSNTRRIGSTASPSLPDPVDRGSRQASDERTVRAYIMAVERRPSFDSKTFLARVGKGRSVREYRQGQVVFSQGEPADAVFYVQKGKVKLTVVSEQGKEAVVAFLGADDFFGEGCLAGQHQRIATVRTMTDAIVTRLEKSAIVRLIHKEPAFSEMFIAHLLGRSIRVEADLVDQLFNSSEKRLARMLLLLANFGKDSKPEPIIAKISQETLAEMIGTTRSRVSFFMNKFRELGFIDYNGSTEGGIEVHSSLLNAVLHHQPQIKT